MSDDLEERPVGVAVRVRRALREVEAALRGEFAHTLRLVAGVQRAHCTSGVDAVAHLANRAERTVEAEVVGDRLHDLLQRRRDDEHLVAAFAMLVDEVQGLGVDERTQHRLHRLRDEPAHLLRREAAQDHEAVLGCAPHRLVARAAQDEEELPARRLRELAAGDEPALAERAGERERRRAAQQRAVEIEERRRGHQPFSPTAANASCRRG